MSIGMTPEQYWEGDVGLAWDFLEADRLRFERRNFDFWLQGVYFYQALGSIISAFSKDGRAQPYLAKPLPTSAESKQAQTEEKRARDEEQEALQARIWMDNFVRAGKRWGKNK